MSNRDEIKEELRKILYDEGMDHCVKLLDDLYKKEDNYILNQLESVDDYHEQTIIDLKSKLEEIKKWSLVPKNLAEVEYHNQFTENIRLHRLGRHKLETL